MECITSLQQRIPPVILKVGMAHPRYVVFGWHERWTVNYTDATSKVQSLDPKGNVYEFDPMNWIVPKMWRTLDGKFSKPVFEKSLHAVLTHIVEKPGCSKVKTRQPRPSGVRLSWQAITLFSHVLC